MKATLEFHKDQISEFFTFIERYTADMSKTKEYGRIEEVVDLLPDMIDDGVVRFETSIESAMIVWEDEYMSVQFGEIDNFAKMIELADFFEVHFNGMNVEISFIFLDVFKPKK